MIMIVTYIRMIVKSDNLPTERKKWYYYTTVPSKNELFKSQCAFLASEVVLFMEALLGWFNCFTNSHSITDDVCVDFISNR